MSVNYVVRTDLDPAGVTEVAVEIFVKWLSFALGQTAIGGKRLYYPTGKYAASLQYRQLGEATVAIVVDEGAAPEAGILEQGHGAVDLKTKLQHGRAYPMHRVVGSPPKVPLRRTGSGPPSLKPTIWAEIRGREASGFASIGPNSSPDSWIIPAMPAYSPALILAAQAQAENRRR